MTAPSQDAAPTPVTPQAAAPATPLAGSAALTKAYQRYRLLAYIVGCVLIVLVLVAVPLKYAAGAPQLVSIVGPIHGVLYIVYLLLTFDMATKARFPFSRTLLVMLAGTIPFVSFVAERWVTRQLRARL
jgi:integral membrane protein